MTPHPFTPLAALALAACASLGPSTAARLASLDPLTADPAAIALVIVLPSGLAVSPRSARLELKAERRKEALTGSFQLTDQPLTEPIALPEGSTARQFALAKVDAVRIRALQEQIAEWKRKGAAHGSLGMGLGGCAIGAGPAPHATGSVLIRVAEGGPLLPLIAEVRLTDLLGPKVMAAIKPCKGGE